MLHRLGRFLQVLGLLIAPAGIAGNLARPDMVDVKTSLAIGAAAIIVFFIGWLLQQAGRRD
jgi:hypothetical protein